MMKTCFITLYIVFMLLVVSVSYAAQTGLQSGSNEPLEITADESLGWKRNEKLFIARRNAKAMQGDVSIAASVLMADYREGKGSDIEIWQVTANRHVVIHSRESSAYGDEAIYNIDKGVAVMTGKNLKMVSPEQTVTAEKSFEYRVTDGKLVATGNAKVVRPKPGGGTDILEAHKITATLKENAKGERALHRMEAVGNVVITTPSEVVKGAYGIYKAETNQAELSGGVTITRGPNILQGEKAVVDLTTNTSRMFGGAREGERVRGVFYPGSEKKPGQNKKAE